MSGAQHVVALLVLVVAASACGGSETEGDGDDLVIATCDSNEGTRTYLHDEAPGIRDLPELITWTESACVINANYLFHRTGDDHCGLEEAEFISIGLPVGTPYTGPEATPPGQDWEPEFFFNADGAWDSEPAGVELDASDIPADAVDLGLKGSGGRTMYLAADESAIWVVQGSVARQFVEPSREVACA